MNANSDNEKLDRMIAVMKYCEGVSTAEIESAPPHLKLRGMLDLVDRDLAGIVAEHIQFKTALTNLCSTVQYCVNRLDADKEQSQVAGDLAVALAIARVALIPPTKER